MYFWDIKFCENVPSCLETLFPLCVVVFRVAGCEEILILQITADKRHLTLLKTVFLPYCGAFVTDLVRVVCTTAARASNASTRRSSSNATRNTVRRCSFVLLK